MADRSLTDAVNQLDDDQFQRLYGPWQPWKPGDVAQHLRGAPFRWWVVGGWSLDLQTPRRRDHEDTDVAVLANDLPALRQWLREFHLWEADSGSLRPLLQDLPLTPGVEQLWVRRDASLPWLLDVALTPSAEATWLYKRDHRVRLPLDDVISVGADGVPYQRPEITLLFKARLKRNKDEEDLRATLPVLTDAARTWLRHALTLTEPGHPWIARLED